MTKMTILYPGSFINYKGIDEDMQGECLAAVETGLFQIVLFNFDEWLGGGKLKVVNIENCSEPVIYRGWMLKPDQYKRLYGDLSDRNIKLITTPEQYEYMHVFPNVYPDIKEDTYRLTICRKDRISKKDIS